MSSFGCTGCGACCRRVKQVDPNWPVQEDGRTCIHLQADNRCGVYETRPAICRVDASKPFTMSQDEWHRLNALACNWMQEDDGLDPSYRVSQTPVPSSGDGLASEEREAGWDRGTSEEDPRGA